MEFSRPETGVGRCSLLQGIFLTQESNRGLLYYRLILYQISYQGSPLLYDSCTKSVIRKQGKIIIIKGGRILGFPSGSDGKVSACNAGETRVWSLGRECPLEKEMVTHSSTFAWKIPWMEEPGWLQSMGLQRVRHDWETSLSLSKS